MHNQRLNKGFFIKEKQFLSNQRGQGLIEYLIIVALVAVAGITVMKVLGQNIRAQYAKISESIQGKDGHSKIEFREVRESDYKERDMSDFFRGNSVKNGNSDE